MNEPDIGLSFTQTLRAELARYRADDMDEPDEAAPVPESPTAREFARALLDALAPEPRFNDTAPMRTVAPRPASQFFEEIRRNRLDPANAASIGPARTTEQSGWITDTCPVCRHSFRQGDTGLAG